MKKKHPSLSIEALAVILLVLVSAGLTWAGTIANSTSSTAITWPGLFSNTVTAPTFNVFDTITQPLITDTGNTTSVGNVIIPPATTDIWDTTGVGSGDKTDPNYYCGVCSKRTINGKTTGFCGRAAYKTPCTDKCTKDSDCPSGSSGGSGGSGGGSTTPAPSTPATPAPSQPAPSEPGDGEKNTKDCCYCKGDFCYHYTGPSYCTCNCKRIDGKGQEYWGCGKKTSHVGIVPGFQNIWTMVLSWFY